MFEQKFQAIHHSPGQVLDGDPSFLRLLQVIRREPLLFGGGEPSEKGQRQFID
jgi:hypothetical protein